MNQQNEQNEVHVEAIVKASVEQTFAAFTERCHDWWPKQYKLSKGERTDIVLEPRVGGRWYEQDASGEECDWGRVLEWNPPHHLALSWQIGVDFVPNPDPELASRVDIQFIEETPEQTIVKLVHSDFERHGEGWESMRDGVADDGGWPGILKSFSSMV